MVNTNCRNNSWCKNLIRAVRGDATINQQQFIDNNNGTVTDLTTGYTWKQEDLPVDDWEDTFVIVANLNQNRFAGHSDWRVPSRNELQSLVDYTRGYPAAINTNYFPSDTSHNYHLTSTTAYGANEECFFIYFLNGVNNHWHKSYNGAVRPVRGGLITGFLTDNGLRLTIQLLILLWRA